MVDFNALPKQRRRKAIDEASFRGDTPDELSGKMSDVRKRAKRTATKVEEDLSLEEDIRHYSEPEEQKATTDAALNNAAEEVERKNTEFQQSHHHTISKQRTKERTMSMIDPTEWSLEDSQEPYALKDGSEVILRIIDVRLDKRDDDSEYYTVRMEVPSEPYSKEITDWLNVPSRNLDAKRLNTAQHKMKSFMLCFSIDTGKLTDPLEDWPGQEGWAILNLTKSDQYGEQNRIAKYIIPR